MDYKSFNLETVVDFILDIPTTDLTERYNLLKYIVGESYTTIEEIFEKNEIIKEYLIRFYPFLDIIEITEEEYENMDKFYERVKKEYSEHILIIPIPREYWLQMNENDIKKR